MRYALTAEQTQFIAGYTFQQGVEWYDVELEVVDHISAWVEDKINQEGLSFDEVYEEMKITFPQKELLQIVQSKKKSISRRTSRLIEKEFLSFFTIPKIFLTVLLVVFSIVVPPMLSVAKMGALFGFLFNVFIFAVFSPQTKKINDMRQLQRCKLLSVKVKSPYEWMFMGFVLLLGILNILRITLPEDQHLAQNQSSETIIFQSGTGVFLLTCLLVYCSSVVRKNILQKIMQEYPYAFTE